MKTCFIGGSMLRPTASPASFDRNNPSCFNCFELCISYFLCVFCRLAAEVYPHCHLNNSITFHHALSYMYLHLSRPVMRLSVLDHIRPPSIISTNQSACWDWYLSQSPAASTRVLAYSSSSHLPVY